MLVENPVDDIHNLQIGGGLSHHGTWQLKMVLPVEKSNSFPPPIKLVKSSLLLPFYRDIDLDYFVAP